MQHDTHQTSSPPPRLNRAEASRRNGARSRGPVTAAGKARSAMNALKHGLTAETFALLPGEDGTAFASLHAALVERYAPADPATAFLVRRLAGAIWRARRAEDLEVEVLTTRERRPDPSSLSGYNPCSPAMWDAGRLNAVIRYAGRIERSFFASLRALEERTAAEAQEVAEEQNEPEEDAAGARSEPEPSEPPLAAAAPPVADARRNEPEREPAGAGPAGEPKPAQAASSPRTEPLPSRPKVGPSPAVIARLLAGGYASLPAGPAGGPTTGGGAGEARGLPRQLLITSGGPLGQAPRLTSAARAACPG
jgi:hypothetical protein